MLNFDYHLTVAITEQLTEAQDVFAMMRKKILASQLAGIPSKGLTQDALAQRQEELKNQIENAPTTDLVQMYSQLTGVLSKEDQEQAEKDAEAQADVAASQGGNTSSDGGGAG